MDKTILEELYQQAQVIAKETATRLAQYHKSVSEIFYGNNPMPIDTGSFPEGTQQQQMKDIAEKHNRFQEQASAKVTFAPEDKMRQAREMEQILQEGNDKIKQLYAERIKEYQATF